MSNSIYYIIGAGAHGRIIGDILKHENHQTIFFVDNKKSIQGTEINGIKVIGSIEDSITKLQDTNSNIIVAIANCLVRKMVIEFIETHNIFITPFISNQAFVASSVRIKKASVIMPFSIINANAEIGEGCIVNSQCFIEQGVKLNKYVSLGPSVKVGGNTIVGEFTTLCSNSNILGNLSIGSKVIVAANSLVTKNINSSLKVKGIVAKPYGKTDLINDWKKII